MRRRIVDLVPQSVVDIELLLQNPAVRQARDDYAAFLSERSGESWTAEPSLDGFAPDIQDLIMRQALIKNGTPYDEREFARKMRQTRPLMAQPEITDPAGDLWRTLAQPEMLRNLWPAVEPRTGRRGRHPGILAKSLLFCVAMLRHSAHLNAVHGTLIADPRLHAVFSWLEGASTESREMRADAFIPTTYSPSLRQMHAIAEGLSPALFLETNIELVKAVHSLLPERTVRLGIDGTLTPAHVAQVNDVSPLYEARLRRRAPNADPKQVRTRFMRGYQLIVLTDLTTGLPLVWVLWPGRMDEAKAIKSLLFTLYQLWPEINADVVVGDGAWNEDWAAEWCLRNYGLHLVAPRTKAQLMTAHPLNPMDYPNIAAFYGDGRAVCRKHRLVMVRDGYQAPSRKGFRPGEPTPSRPFRLRYTCPADPSCGRLSLPAEEHWCALSYYPHSLDAGEPALHAERLALAHRRNACEAMFSAIQVGNKLSLFGAARTRTAKEPTVTALLSLALVQRSAFALAALRIERGLFREDLPEELAQFAA